MEEFDAAKPAAAPETTPGEQPRMSEVSTVINIFFDPGETFLDLKRRPRFILATIIVSLFFSAFSFAIYYKVGEESVRRFAMEQIEKSPRASAMTSEEKTRAVEMQMTFGTYARFAFPLIMAILLAVGGLFYWLAAKAFGGTGTFLHGWAVWVYSSLPPTVVGMIANFIVLLFKPAEEIDLAVSQRGVIQANLGFLIDGKESPVLATLVGTFDLFAIWGWILAAIGLRITNRLSSGSAWAIVLIFALLSVTFRVLLAFISKSPM